MAAVPDESQDPMRRIRAALGKLVWKRNQLVRLPLQPAWVDESAWVCLARDEFLVHSVKDQLHTQQEHSSDLRALELYMRDLHVTELRLRRLVIDRFSELPISVVATAGDERPGSMESMDLASENEEVEWLESGHDLLEKQLFRPAAVCLEGESGISPCQWYTVSGHSEPIELSEDDGDVGQVFGINGKEPAVVKKRRHFRVTPLHIPGYETLSDEELVLTEAQIHCGLRAAELERKSSSDQMIQRNPFAGSKAAHISLVSASSTIAARVVGHTSEITGEGNCVYRILLIPTNRAPQDSKAVWGELRYADSGALECRLEEAGVVYTVQQFEYHIDSPAYIACLSIVSFLERHAKAGPFLAPVDPVALGIPSYFTVVKNPMDISTLAENLKNGKYSTIPPHMARGRNATARMLNGPFRRDVELIFDNAMLFNPPDDWIHQSALSLKKAVIRKIDQSISNSESASRYRAKASSVYVDEDSDADDYVYESDQDEEFTTGGRRGRIRGNKVKSPVKEDSASRAIERIVKLHKLFDGQLGLKGAFASLSVNSEAGSFSLPKDWGCSLQSSSESIVPDEKSTGADTDLDNLLALQRALDEERETGGTYRRPRRGETTTDSRSLSTSTAVNVEYYRSSAEDDRTFSNRIQVEMELERLHEERFASLFFRLRDLFQKEAKVGGFVGDSFPPYLGHVTPTLSDSCMKSQLSSIDRANGNAQWEIRSDFLIPALRWVIRGLVQSEHLSQLDDGDLILPNHVYYIDPQADPFEVLDTRESSRRKRAANELIEVEDEVELSEYEKLRLERVARNKERLAALGLG